MFRKNRSHAARGSIVTAFVTTLFACWHSPSSHSSPPPLANTAPPAPARAAHPSLPSVTSADFGTWDASGELHPAVDIPLFAGSAFGWKLTLPCPGPTIGIDEEMHLPAPGDWGNDPDMEISADGKNVRVRYVAECRDNTVLKSWSVSANDPAGTWIIKVTPDGFQTETFRASFEP